MKMDLIKEGSTSEVVLLTGSSGCLGYQTLKLLLTHDGKTKEIRCLDLIKPSEMMRQEIDHDLKKCSPNADKVVEFIQGDIRDINLIESILSDMQVNCIIHCAAKVDIWTSKDEQDSSELESINVGGTENLLKSCIRFGIPKFIHVSTFETFVSYHTIYYATENTIPEPDSLLFGASGHSKRLAEIKVKQYANNKLRPFKKTNHELGTNNDFLNAIIVRYTPIYGEHDNHFVSKYLKLANHFSGKLQRFTNIWIRQQPIYVGNAAWALICAKNKMDVDETISGEDFHITDDTPIGDPFDFLAQFLECKHFHLSKSTMPGLAVWLLMVLFFWLAKLICMLDIFNLFTKRRGRLQEAIEQDQRLTSSSKDKNKLLENASSNKRWWYHLVTPEMFFFTINSLFLNRTKASLRLNYAPLFDYEKSRTNSIAWYKDGLKL